MSLSSVPKCDAGLARQRVGQKVSLIGRVEQTLAGGLTLTAADNQTISVRFGHSTSAPNACVAAYVEVIGVVQADGSIFAEEVCALPPGNFDMANWAEVIRVSHVLQGVF